MRSLVVLMALAGCLIVTSGFREGAKSPNDAAVVIMGIGTAHPSGVNSLFSDVPAIEIRWVPIDMRRLTIDRSRPPLIMRREYCNPLALDREDCPAADRQVLYSAFEAPAGIYMLRSITVTNSDLLDSLRVTTEYFYPPDHLVFRDTLPEAMADPAVPKLLLAPGGLYYAGNLIVDFDRQAPRIASVERDEDAAIDVVREELGGDVTLQFLDIALSFVRGVES